MNAPHKPGLPQAPDLPDLSERPPNFGTGVVYPPLGETEEDREAAIQHLFSMSEFAQPSDGEKMTRDEMHER